MDARRESEPARMKNRTTVERKSEREMVVTRTFNGPARLVFEAWTKPELFKRWWVPKSTGMSLLSCEMDVRVGGKYRLVFASDPQPMEFFGRYIEVTPHARLVWTNDEPGEGGAVTTVTFEEKGARRCWSCTTSIPRRKLSTSAPGAWMRCPRRSTNWRSFSSRWARRRPKSSITRQTGDLHSFLRAKGFRIGDMEETAFNPKRRLCPDGSCVGVLGADGRCSVCQRSAGAACRRSVEAAEPWAERRGPGDDARPRSGSGLRLRSGPPPVRRRELRRCRGRRRRLRHLRPESGLACPASPSSGPRARRRSSATRRSAPTFARAGRSTR